MPHQHHLLSTDGYIRAPILDLDGYLDSIERCRHRFPELRILTGVEFGQPHLHEAQASDLLDLGVIDRVLGSLHTLEVGDDRSEPNTLFRKWGADEVMWAYLEEIPRMVAGSQTFDCSPISTTQCVHGRPKSPDLSIPADSRTDSEMGCAPSPKAVGRSR
ncbi:hypothetical protein ACSVIA_27945 [Rhodococcus erythropolis]